MSRNERIRKLVVKIVSIVILVAALIFLIYKFGFEDYTKAEYVGGKSSFEKELSGGYSGKGGFFIENRELNDAMIYKSINVKENTPYKFTCMVKTENVECENSFCGAHLSILNTTENSGFISGTNDWQKVEFYFNSKNRNKLKLGFRLGGYGGNCTGKAWFSDMKLEEGVNDLSNNWNCLFLFFKNTDVNIAGKEYKVSVSDEEIENMKNVMKRFRSSMSALSNNKLQVTCEYAEIDTPLTSMDYNQNSQYYVSPYNIKGVLDKSIEEGKYDHIFAIFKTGSSDEQGQNKIPTGSWIGLGNMVYQDVGFSDIRFNDSMDTYSYDYDKDTNTFPEEVFVHEFLHGLERISIDCNYETIELHDNEKYGYLKNDAEGLKKWYNDYLQKIIVSNGRNVGLDERVSTIKPAKVSQFNNPTELHYFDKKGILGSVGAFIKGIFNRDDDVEINTNLQTVSE